MFLLALSKNGSKNNFRHLKMPLKIISGTSPTCLKKQF
jgi:hypothetical protein